MMFSQIPDPLLRKRLAEFRDYLPENRREQFTDLVVASFFSGKDYESEVWNRALESFREAKAQEAVLRGHLPSMRV